MDATCSACGNEHSDPSWRPGHSFVCLCGETVIVPAPQTRLESVIGWSTGRILLTLGIAAVIPAIGVVTLFLLVGLPAYERAKEYTVASEAITNVKRLCGAVHSHQRSTGEWLASEAAPNYVPGGPIPFEPTPEMKILGFAPPTVQHQYWVQHYGDPAQDGYVMCLATGDRDGDGLRSSFTVTLIPGKRPGRVVVSNEFE